MSHETAPIIVSGVPRSGTTWMQWFLSQHQRIHIHGQAPNVPWSEMWGWCERMTKQGAWAQRAQQYAIAHYAGSSPPRCREAFKRLYYEFTTGLGPAKPRWGMKSLWMCAKPDEIDQVSSLWSDVRWVICIRDPFRSFESAKNTFEPEMEATEWFARWIAVASFVKDNSDGNVASFQIDRLSGAAEPVRSAQLKTVMDVIGESPTKETAAFIRRWPRVHQVVPQSKRKFTISEQESRQVLQEFPELSTLMRRLGYKPPVSVSSSARVSSVS